MARKMTKTARSALRAGSSGSKTGFERSLAAPRIIPTGQGSKAYLFDDHGKTHHLWVGSDSFISVLADLLEAKDADSTKKAVQENIKLWPEAGWDKSLIKAEQIIENKNQDAPQP